MSAPTILLGAPPPEIPLGVDCRVRERQPLGLQTSCQPIAARADKDVLWPAQIRDISVSGLGLVLGRRFEPGAGLAIEVPGTDSTCADTLLARVVHVVAWPGGGWLLGCAFVSELSDDEVRVLLELAQAQQNAVQPPRGATTPVAEQPTAPPDKDPTRTVLVCGLNFEGTRAEHKPANVAVRRLYLAGTWPVPAGTLLRVRVAHMTPDHPGLTLKVNRCSLEGDRWTVNYTLVGNPSTDMLRLFGYLNSLPQLDD